MKKINIAGIDKARLLKALYDGSKIQGNSYIGYSGNEFTLEDAKMALRETRSFDYVNGRVIKVNLSGDEFDPWFYDRDNGDGAAQRIVDALR